jgi:hypothetical protein
MNEPFYIRPSAYRYCLRSQPEYGWATGITEDGSLVLQCEIWGPYWFIFDGEGTFVQVTEEPVRFREAPIEVRRFWVADRGGMGIEDLPEELSELYTAPDEAVMEPGDVEAWLGDGQFMFYPGWGSFIMGGNGNVEAD